MMRAHKVVPVLLLLPLVATARAQDASDCANITTRRSLNRRYGNDAPRKVGRALAQTLENWRCWSNSRASASLSPPAPRP